MRFTAAALALLLASCSVASTQEPSRWRPMPIPGATEPSQVIANSTPSDWREIDPENLMVMELGDGGRVVIELAPEFAPIHVANMRAFARAGWWNNATIYRVQDNYVAQWGNGDAEVPLPAGVVQRPPAEYERTLAGLQLVETPYPDAYAGTVGYAGGWPVAFDRDAGLAWLPHCYGTVGVGRDLAPDTGTGDLGFYQADRGETAVPIRMIRLASDMPAAQRPRFEAMRTDSAAFNDYVRGRANRGGTFFNRPAGGVDLCNAPVPVRRKAS